MREPLLDACVSEGTFTVTTAPVRSPPSLLERAVRASRLPWWGVGVLYAGLAVVAIVVVLWVDGALPELRRLSMWRNAYLYPAVTAYLLVVEPLLYRYRDRAIEVFRPLGEMSDEEFDRFKAETPVLTPLGELASAAVGVGAAYAILQPWGGGEPGVYSAVYVWAVIGIAFGLLARTIHMGLAMALLLARLHRLPMRIDIFEPSTLYPVGIWSLAMSLTVIGAITVSMLFIAPDTFMSRQTLTIYSVLIASAVAVFFLTLHPTHGKMAEAKGRQMEIARARRAESLAVLNQTATAGDAAAVREHSSAFAGWVAYESLVREAPTWPFNITTVWRLAFSIGAPIIAGAIKILPTVLKFR